MSCVKHPLSETMPSFDNTFDQDEFSVYEFKGNIDKDKLKLYPILNKDSEGKEIIKWKEPQKKEKQELLGLFYSSYEFHNDYGYRKHLLNI